MEMGFTFIWPPGDNPYFITPSGQIIALEMHELFPPLWIFLEAVFVVKYGCSIDHWLQTTFQNIAVKRANTWVDFDPERPPRTALRTGLSGASDGAFCRFSQCTMLWRRLRSPRCHMQRRG